MILHLLSRESWAEAQAHGQLIAQSVATEGFAHCSTEHQIVDVANKYYSGANNMVLLNIDPARLTSKLIFEPPAHLDGSPALPHEPMFPHIYGPINLDAVIEVIDFPCDFKGHFSSPPQLNTFSVVDIANAPHHWQRAAELSVTEWKKYFPDDTVQTYFDLYGRTGQYEGHFAETFIAVNPEKLLLTMTNYLSQTSLDHGWQQCLLCRPHGSTVLAPRSFSELFNAPTNSGITNCFFIPQTSKSGIPKRVGFSLAKLNLMALRIP